MMEDIDLITNSKNAKFERCIEFLVRMMEKYGDMIQPATAEDVRKRFSVRQCQKSV